MKTVNGEETVYTYNALNQLVSENDITYEYDLNGNTVRMTSPDKSALYVYNADNCLIRATVQSGNNVSVEEYRYDYAGNRISKSSEGDYTKYLLDVSGSLTYVLAEMDYDGAEKCFYTRGTDLVSQERDGKKFYYVYDGHGSVRALADDSGKVTDTYNYDAFGNLISSVGSTKNDFLFCGEQYDPVTGLYYLRARYMNPSVGTFISMDSYSGSIDDPVSLHKYLYANANPVNNSDPSGYSVENALGFYQQTWLTVEQAISYEHQLLNSCINELAYNENVRKIGLEIIKQLTLTGLEISLTSALTLLIGPTAAKVIASGIVKSIDMALSVKQSSIKEKMPEIENMDTFLPEPYYEKTNKAVQHELLEPNTLQIRSSWGGHSKEVETALIASDMSGRVIFRFDFSYHGIKKDHGDIPLHFHFYDYSGGSGKEITYIYDLFEGMFRTK